MDELPDLTLPPPQATAPPVAESLRRNSRAVAIAQVLSQLVTLGAMAVLLRLLGPDPYGLMTTVLAVLSLVRILVSSGLDLATIQQEELSDAQVSALFWVNQALGLAGTLVVAAFAPPLAWLMGKPILGLTVAMAGTSWVSVWGIQHLALLQRKLRLGTVAYLRLIALALGSAAGIAAAWADWGVWALVVQQYVELLALAGIAWAIEPWRPQFRWPGVAIGRLLRFGGHCTFSSLMFGLINSIDKLLMSPFVGEAVVGLYGQAFNLMQKPVSVVVTPLTTSIMMPSLARANGDREQFRHLTLIFFRFLGLVMLPTGLGLAVVAPEAIVVLGGARWTAAGPILAVLALSILVQGFFIAMGSVLAAAGQTAWLARASLVNAVVMSASYGVGLFLGQRWGDAVLGVATAYTVTLGCLVFPAYLVCSLRVLQIPLRAWLGQLKISLPAALGMGAIVWAGRWLLVRQFTWPAGALLAAEVTLGVVVYTLLAWKDLRRFLHHGLRNADQAG